MTLKLTRAELEALNPCGLDQRLALFGRRNSMTAAQALKAGASIDELLWVAGRIGRKDLCVKFALICAQRVAHLNPDPRVKGALSAAEAWIADPTEPNRVAAGNAAAGNAAVWAALWAAGATGATGAARAAVWAARIYRAAGGAEQEAQRAVFLEVFK